MHDKFLSWKQWATLKWADGIACASADVAVRLVEGTRDFTRAALLTLDKQRDRPHTQDASPGCKGANLVSTRTPTVLRTQVITVADLDTKLSCTTVADNICKTRVAGRYTIEREI